MDKVILVACPYLTDCGRSIGIESDIHRHFLDTFTASEVEIVEPEWTVSPETNSITLNTRSLRHLIAANPEAIVFIDGNIPPNAPGTTYPEDLITILRERIGKNIVLLPDLQHTEPDMYDLWLHCSNFIITFQKIGAEWANENYNTTAFRYYNCIPVPSRRCDDFDEFMRRPIDMGYAGSSKNFRESFIGMMLAENRENRIISKVSSHTRSGSNLKTTREYMRFLSECRFVFATRANLHEIYPPTDVSPLPRQAPGRFAGRVAEALAVGAIPLYWEPPRKSGKLSKRRASLAFGSRFRALKRIAFRGWGRSDAWPFDDDPGMHSGIVVVLDPWEALQALSMPKERLAAIFQEGSALFERLAQPRRFVEWLEFELSKDNERHIDFSAEKSHGDDRQDETNH